LDAILPNAARCALAKNQLSLGGMSVGYLHPNHAGDLAMGEAVGIQLFAPLTCALHHYYR